MVKRREPYLKKDEIDIHRNAPLFSEIQFMDPNQLVEKADIDMHNLYFKNEKITYDLHFVAPLQHLNQLFIKDSWKTNIEQDILQLPCPFWNISFFFKFE